MTPALKEYEETVLTAAERIEARERELFDALRARGRRARSLACSAIARAVAELDVLGDARRGRGARGVRAADDRRTTFELEIAAGRHPVVERMMPRDKFIPNDLRLVEDARVIILTGPNMAGKSTILRQIGLIVLMAQAGSFVPARPRASASSIGSSRASARATIWCAGSRRSWSR